MNEHTTIATRTIVVDYDLTYPPEEVWRAISESDLLAKWLMRNDFRPTVGHKFTFYTEPMPAVGFDGIVHCEVLVVDPPRHLRWTQQSGAVDTVVDWTLYPTATGTRLHLEHSGFKPENAIAYEALNSGWRSMKPARFEAALANL